MPKPSVRPSAYASAEFIELQEENERLRKQVAQLKAQIAALHVGLKAVLDAVGLPDIEKPN